MIHLKSFIKTCFFTIIILLCNISNLEAKSSIVLANVEKIFIPKGYDSNDNVEIVVSGHFKNLCYKFNKIKSSIDKKRKIIKIGVTAIKSIRANCLKVVVPFKEIVSLGILAPGTWKVYVNKNTLYHSQKSFRIAPADSEMVDNYVYSFVDYVKYLGQNKFELYAFRPSNCFVFEKVKVFFNGLDTFSILPILRQEIDFCPYKMIQMKIPFEVNLEQVKTSKVLIHVRSLEGKSFNKIIDID